MAITDLAYHPTVNHYLKYVATTVGRDKFLRIIQYFSRFYAWYLYRQNGTPSEVYPWTQTKTQLALIRKCFRLGKSVEHLKAAAVALDSNTSTQQSGWSPTELALLKWCQVGRQLGYAGYMFFDNLTFPTVTGIARSPAAKAAGARAQTRAYKCWYVGILFNIVAGTYQVLRLRQRERLADRKKGEGAVEVKRLQKERDALRLQLVCDACDIMVPAIGLGWDRGKLDDGIVGLGGVVSSAIGAKAVWDKTA